MGRIWSALGRGAGGSADQHGDEGDLDNAHRGATSMSETGGQAPAFEPRPDETAAEPGTTADSRSGALPDPNEDGVPKAAAETDRGAPLDAGSGEAASSVDEPSPQQLQDVPSADGALPSDAPAQGSGAVPGQDTLSELSGPPVADAAAQDDADTMPLPESPQGVGAEFAAGTLLADRFTILRELAPEAASAMLGGPLPAQVTAQYAVEDRLYSERCWACGSTHNDPSDATQRFCVDCGAPRQQEWVLARSAVPTGRQDEIADKGAYFRILHRRKQFGSGGMAVEVGAFSAEGPHHPNEDSFWTGITSGCYDSKVDAVCVAVLADGMGGYAPGSGLISKTVVSMVGSYVFGRVAVNRTGELVEEDLRGIVREAIEQANGKVLAEISRHGDMGSTLVLAVVYGRAVYVANIGDSRAYYVSPSGDVSQITRDQSLVQQQVSLGLMSADAVFTAAGNNVILHAVGEERVEEMFDWYVQDIEPDSHVLLCTDGYWKTMRQKIWDSSLGSPESSLHDLAARLVQTAIDQNSDDNTTVMLVGIA